MTNTADVPISVTSHFHFFEVNPRLRFDRGRAYGRHLAIPPATVALRPRRADGRVGLLPIGGDRVASASPGWSTARWTRRAPGRTPWREPARPDTWTAIRSTDQAAWDDGPARTSTSRACPSPGDRVRLGDTGLVVRVERRRPTPTSSCSPASARPPATASA